jgi:hypothetical protein
MSCQDTAAKTGQIILFCGVDTDSWSMEQFKAAAAFAAAHKVDSLLVKVAEGAIRWYGNTIDGWRAIRSTILSQGVGAIPYIFSYGDYYGGLHNEINLLIEYMQEDGVVCSDMEAAWNGETGWAQTLCNAIKPIPGIFLCSTWADPDEQNWANVIRALNPCVNSYLPQEYDTWLAGRQWEFVSDGAACLFPTIDLANDVGPNDPVGLTAAAHSQGHAALSIWHYDIAMANPHLLDQVVSAFPKATLSGISPTSPTTKGPTIMKTTGAYNSNPNVKKNLDDWWNSSANMLPGQQPAPTNTGIHGAWVILCENGHFLGAPASLEYKSTDYNGAEIVCQNFLGGVRCTWDQKAVARFYGPDGQLNWQISS